MRISAMLYQDAICEGTSRVACAKGRETLRGQFDNYDSSLVVNRRDNLLDIDRTTDTARRPRASDDYLSQQVVKMDRNGPDF